MRRRFAWLYELATSPAAVAERDKVFWVRRLVYFGFGSGAAPALAPAPAPAPAPVVAFVARLPASILQHAAHHRALYFRYLLRARIRRDFFVLDLANTASSF